MKPHYSRADRGVALIITLIMLSVVTITTVAFLAVARRERTGVALAGEQVDIRLLADTALARGKADILSRVLANTNWTAAHYSVSTNFLQPYYRGTAGKSAGYLLDFDFHDVDHVSLLTNVSYYNSSGKPWNISDPNEAKQYREMLANLYYDARVPVVVQTNRGAQNKRMEFRFYLDLNQNRQFETNGLYFPSDSSGLAVGTLPQWIYGDPEWIGILEHPDKPHSGTNHFIGRVAYVAIPASRTLNINYAGNLVAPAGRGGQGASGAFRRNQGIGTWEFNLGAFFRDLNTNLFNSYTYNNASGSANSGRAFAYADPLVAWRFQGQEANNTLNGFVQRNTDLTGVNLVSPAFFVGADLYSDGPYVKTNDIFAAYGTGTGVRDTAVKTRWPGADPVRKVNSIIDEPFSTNLWNASSPFSRASLIAADANTKQLNTYHENTFYRLLQQLGTDTGDGRFESGEEVGGHFYLRPKLNINFAQDNPDGPLLANANPSYLTNGGFNPGFRRWDAATWMNYAVDRMLRTEFTNGLTRWQTLTNTAWIYGTNRLDDSPLGFPIVVFGPTNPPGSSATLTVPIVNYTAQVHRMAQLAANIYDSTTNRGASYPYLPTVFRPLVYRDVYTNVIYKTNSGVVTATPGKAYPALRLFGFEEVTDAASSLFSSTVSNLWVDLNTVSNLNTASLHTLSEILPKTSSARVLTNLMARNIVGLPWVVGAKKGLPSFNESFSQTSLEVTRRLNVTKPIGRLLATNQTPFDFNARVSYLFKITNFFSSEAWNSYIAQFPVDRPLAVVTSNIVDMALFDSSLTNFPNAILGQPLNLPYTVGTTNTLTTYFHSASSSSNTVKGWTGRGYFPTLTNAIVTSFYFNPTLAPGSRVLNGNSLNDNVFVAANALPPKIGVAVTNRLVMAIIDINSGRLLDFVNLKSVMMETNVMPYLTLGAAGGLGGNGLSMSDFWRTNVSRVPNIPVGLTNQSTISTAILGYPNTQFWKDAPGFRSVADARASFYFFLYGQLPANALGTVDVAQFITNASTHSVTFQSGFNPSASVVLTDRRMANDPLVHYTMEDLGPGTTISTAAGSQGFISFVGAYTPYGLYTNIPPGDPAIFRNQIGSVNKKVIMYAPWGTNGILPWASGGTATAQATRFDPALKDPMIRSSDDWIFPTNYFDTLGEIGRVHRGSPWQTVYLKSLVATNPAGGFFYRYSGLGNSWASWSGNYGTHPTNDWKLLQLFTTAINDNAAQGLMSVNQTNIAAWSALLAGTPIVQTNGTYTTIPPASTVLNTILGGTANVTPANGVIPTQASMPTKAFQHMGDILAVPTLSVASPYVPPWNYNNNPLRVRDEVVERLPQQILPLIREDEPRFVIYSFAQTLKPAPGATYTGLDPLFGLCTNYVVTGETATKTVLRFDGRPIRSEVRTVVEDHQVLSSSNSN
ncbi:MAG TPA: hypothetical protein VMF06_21335 [Candidatus Limnocylindria bacterium]|jgi:hypothetical protein|nr:hypothetical protein [Candidatus Limnocylindria bacterium]